MPGATAEARADLAEALVRTAWANGEHLLGESVQEAPIEMGHLRESGHKVLLVGGVEFTDLAPAVDHARRLAAGGQRFEIAFEVRFGTPYAAAQHEGRATMHRGGRTWRWVVTRHPRGGKTKYLQDPLVRFSRRYLDNMQRAVDAVQSGGRDALARLRAAQNG